MFSTPTSWPTPSAASGDKGLGGGSPVFPSPTKLQNNGLDGEELGTETTPYPYAYTVYGRYQRKYIGVIIRGRITIGHMFRVRNLVNTTI